MKGKRKLFDELVQGVDAMRKQHEGKVTLRTHAVEKLPPLHVSDLSDLQVTELSEFPSFVACGLEGRSGLAYAPSVTTSGPQYGHGANMSDVTVRARVDAALKEHATQVLDEMGLSVSEAIRLLLVQVVERRKLPFEIRALSPETVQALKDAEAGKTTPLKSRDL